MRRILILFLLLPFYCIPITLKAQSLKPKTSFNYLVQQPNNLSQQLPGDVSNIVSYELLNRRINPANLIVYLGFIPRFVNFNWITIWLSFFFGVLFTILFRFLNKNSKAVDQRSNPALPLGGWIIVLGVTLFIRFAYQGYLFANENYYLKSIWIELETAGGPKLQTIYIFEMVLSLFAIAGTGALIYWYFGRRDIFPGLFVGYVVILLMAQFVLFIMYSSVDLPAMVDARKNLLTQVYRMGIYGVIWISFILKSKRVKQTFVYPPN